MHGTTKRVQRVMRSPAKSLIKSPALVMDMQAIDLMSDLANHEARESFWAFRQHMRPTMLRGWWQREVARQLQIFWIRYCNGERPKLVLQAPPQHGKSWQVTDFIGWVAGKNPDLKAIYASYSDELGVKANAHLQRLYDDEKYGNVFPDTAISASSSLGPGQSRNSGFLEYLGRDGSFRNTTVGGQITGQGLDLGVVDDPIKGRQEAQSKAARDKAWSWFMDDFFTRFSNFAGLILMMTRWHLDDPAGRFLEAYPDATVCSFPAVAVEDEVYRDPGDALFPEHKPIEFLLERKAGMTLSSWESLYQQNPIIVGGGLFPIEKFKMVPVAPSRKDVRKSVRYWDKAGTQDGGAYTAGVLIHDLKEDAGMVVSDVRRGQWSALERETRIRQTADIDKASGYNVETWVEQEPGSGGKESAERTIANLRGYVVKADKVTGSKEVRAEPYAAQVQGGNVALVAGPWVQPFMDEHENFPTGKYRDQVDAAGGAFAKACVRSYGSYDSTMGWVGGPGTGRRTSI